MKCAIKVTRQRKEKSNGKVFSLGTLHGVNNEGMWQRDD